MHQPILQKCLVALAITSVSCFAKAITWQDVGNLASGNLPNATCSVRLATPTSNAGVYQYLYPASKQQAGIDLKLDFSNYTIAQLQNYFIHIPDNHWENFYSSNSNAQKQYPYHVAQFGLSIMKSGKYLVTSSTVNLKSGTQSISIGTPIPQIASHSYIKIQQLCF